MSISPTVREAWLANLRVNEVLVAHLDAEMMTARTPGGGMTVAQQLAHITGTTKYWGMNFADAFQALPDLGPDDGAPEAAERDPTRVREVVADVARGSLAAAEAAEDQGSLPHPSVEAYLIHMMVHDAHHRGQMLLALKDAGHPLPDEDAMWGPWRGE